MEGLVHRLAGPDDEVGEAGTLHHEIGDTAESDPPEAASSVGRQGDQADTVVLGVVDDCPAGAAGLGEVLHLEAFALEAGGDFGEVLVGLVLAAYQRFRRRRPVVAGGRLDNGARSGGDLE